MVKDGDEVAAGQTLIMVGAYAVTAERAGRVSLEEKYLKVTYAAEKTKEFIIPKGLSLLVKEGEEVKKGDQLTEGSLDLQQLYSLRGKLATQKYIIKEIQDVYSSQGQPLNDKHIEIIAKQMFSRYFIVDSGGTDLLAGEVVEKAVLERAKKKNESLTEDQAPKTNRLLLGITKASLTTDSFLSAASFQETARVLIEAAVNGKIDYLEGLKENVIIGRLIPAGTGYKGRQERAVY